MVSLEQAVEGADQVVYFTHDYFSMVSCKNNSLEATAKVAQKLGVSNVVAVCPVEHDMAWSESDKTWVEQRQVAEQNALSANKNMSILNTDLVFGKYPSHLVHYMTQCAFAGKIQGPVISDVAKFKPVSQTDLTRAVTTSMDSRLKG